LTLALNLRSLAHEIEKPREIEAFSLRIVGIVRMLRTIGAHSRVQIGVCLSVLNVALQKAEPDAVQASSASRLGARASGSLYQRKALVTVLLQSQKKTLVKCHLTGYNSV
jgi:hypothetical protein